MKRRTFLGVIAGSLLTAPLAGEAQQRVQAEVRSVGWLAMAPQPTLQAEFQRGMHALGYVDGSTGRFTSATLRTPSRSSRP
jgi:hypothetical protein